MRGLSKNTMGIVLAGSLLLILAILTGLYGYSRSRSPRDRPVPAVPLKQQEQAMVSLGLKDGWEEYAPESEVVLMRWRPVSVKVLFHMTDDQGQYLFLADKKRSMGKRRYRKDSLWEFPGGRVDAGESVSEAMVRELGEEDPSGTLSSVFKDARKITQGLFFKNLLLKNGEKHTLFKVRLLPERWKVLKSFWRDHPPISREIYEFSMVPLLLLDLKNKGTGGRWTPKSKKILKSLRREQA